MRAYLIYMVSNAEVMARDLFSEGKKSYEVKKALGECGINLSISTIKVYRSAFNGGYLSSREYVKDKTRKHMKLAEDPYFLEISPSLENISHISESNYFILLLRSLNGDGESGEMLKKVAKGNKSLRHIEFLVYLRDGLKEGGIMSEGSYKSEITGKGRDLLKRYGLSLET